MKADPSGTQEHHLFLASKPARGTALGLRSLLLNSAIHFVDTIVDLAPSVLAKLIELLPSILRHLGNLLIKLELGAGVVDLRRSAEFTKYMLRR